MKRVAVAVVMALALGVCAAEWFDAGISGYTQWPSDGSDFPVVGEGTWHGTTNATLVRKDGQSRLSVFTRGDADVLSFGPKSSRTLPRIRYSR